MIGTFLLSLGLSVTSANAADILPFLGFKAGPQFGIGTMSNSSKSTPSRSVNTLGLNALVGYKFPSNLLIGPSFEYRIVSQPGSTGPDLKGNGYVGGVGMAFSFFPVPISIGANLDFLGKHSISQKVLGADQSFSGVFGYRLLAGFSIFPAVSLDFIFSQHRYSDYKLGGTTLDISSDKLTHTSYGLGLAVQL